MSDPRRRRFKFYPSQVGNMPARPTVTRPTVPLKTNGERRHAFTARPDDARFVSWHDHEQARTNLAIQKAVATENLWKRK